MAASSLSYDGNMNIFLNDYDNKPVYVFSAISKNHRQLLSPHHIKNETCILAVDKSTTVLRTRKECFRGV